MSGDASWDGVAMNWASAVGVGVGLAKKNNWETSQKPIWASGLMLLSINSFIDHVIGYGQPE